MCGVQGIVRHNCFEKSDIKTDIRKMGFIQNHRGPDAWGEKIVDNVALGHNRLSIFDIEGGSQPISSSDKGVHLIFNGEIYNNQFLRTILEAKGYKFKSSHSDTETIFVGYIEWGAKVFEKLSGMFAIAIYDEKKREIILARDRYGIKPLYFYDSNSQFIFSSEIKGILNIDSVETSINNDLIPDYFQFRSTIGSNTLIKGISKLIPGHKLIYSIDKKSTSINKFWEFIPTKYKNKNYKEAKEELRELLKKSIKMHTQSDVPISMFLSGGTDSSLIAALMRSHINFKAFTISTNSFLDESKFAKIISKKLDIDLHILNIKGKDFVRNFDKWSFHNDDPVSDPSALAQLCLSKFAHDMGLKVVITGEGSDEIFGGYNSYLRYKFFKRLSRLPFTKYNQTLRKFLPSRDQDYLKNIDKIQFLGTAHCLPGKLYQEIFIEGQKSFFDDEYLNNLVDDYSKRAMVFDQQIRLPNDLLPRTDRSTMAYSLEARVPFLDNNLVDFANSLPSKWCFNQLRTKIILKDLACEYIPKSLVYRKKRGFDLPIKEWLLKDFRKLIAYFLDSKSIHGLNYEKLNLLYKNLDRGEKLHVSILWQWLVLENWHRIWFKEKHHV